MTGTDEYTELGMPGDGFVYVRKSMVAGRCEQLRLPYNSLSRRGLFAVTGDIGILDIDDDVEIVLGSSSSLVATVGGRVVESNRSFGDSRPEAMDGYTILFDRPDEKLRAVVDAYQRDKP